MKSKYPVAMNSLGEMICLGCGVHFPQLTRPRHVVQAFCSHACAARVAYNGGRLTRDDVRDYIAAMWSASA